MTVPTPNVGIFDGVVDDAVGKVTGIFRDFWTGLWTPVLDAWPLWHAYIVFGIVFVVCLFLAFFLQFKWVRLGLLVIILLAGAMLTGQVTMYNTMKARMNEERARSKRHR